MFTCKCLNISINTKTLNLPRVDIESLGLPMEKRRDMFFKEDLAKADILLIAKEQACLVHVRSVACWIIYRCLNCNMETHALHRDKGATYVLINLKMLTDHDVITSLRASTMYSSVFRIVISFEMESISSENNFSDLSVLGSKQATLAALQLQLTEALQREAQKVEERVRLYSEEQYTQLEEFQKKAHDDHRMLSRLLIEAESTPTVGSPAALQTHLASSEPRSASTPLMPTLPPPPFLCKQTLSDSVVVYPSVASLSSIVPLPEVSHVANHTISNQKYISYSEPRPVPSFLVKNSKLAEKSADSEGLFLLDEVDENPPGTFQSEDETDTDDSGSHDEGIHIPRARGISSNLAQSLPVSVPAFSGERSRGDDFEEESMLSHDPVDIAASIKALARSVHGDTVFGDLPRPRFSSQI